MNCRNKIEDYGLTLRVTLAKMFGLHFEALPVMYPKTTLLFKTLFPMVVAFVLHYVTLRAYNAYCLPAGFGGFFQGFLLSGSPFCKTLLDLSVTFQNNYSLMIVALLTRCLMDLGGGGSLHTN